MKTFYNDQAKPLLKFFTKTKSEIRNLKLKQILDEGFISKPQGKGRNLSKTRRKMSGR